MNAGRAAVLRMALAAALLLPACVLHGERIVQSLLPFFAEVFSRVAVDFRLLGLAVVREGADTVVQATVMWRHFMVVNGRVMQPDPQATAHASTLLAHALQAPLAALVAACAWPVGRAGGVRTAVEVAARGACLLPLLALLLAADLPLVLAGELWGLVLEVLDPSAWSALVAWKDFLQGGGRHALGLLAVALAAAAGRWISALPVRAAAPPAAAA
ncbi:MAG: hypothetical protein EPO01_02140 [Aquabacterium sp.]|nr:MAG: hypothetical protein EPO01_02140 [Aquabacterium sp.]